MTRFLVLLFTALSLVACRPADDTVDLVGRGNTFAPGDVASIEQAFRTATDCGTAAITFTIDEAALPNFVPGRDGAISEAGVFTAPSCGSPYVGGILHVRGLCTANGRQGVAALDIAEEVLRYLDIAYMVRDEGTPNACLLPHVAMNSACPGDTRLCGDPDGCFCIGIGETAQAHAGLVLTCQTIYSPGLPNPLPGVCTMGTAVQSVPMAKARAMALEGFRIP